MINRVYRTWRRLRGRRNTASEDERRRGEDRRQLADRREEMRYGEQLICRRRRERRYSQDIRPAN